MGAYLADRAAFVYGSVAVDNVVVAYAGKVPGAVPAVYIHNGIVASFLSGATVNNNAIYFSHFGIPP